ncbi:TlpA family protein disulfide reductase [Sulfuricystis multivorans]|uniref:TlpA family protein disulfide reductase n=1 Tax=Sulfuricystis multivorans TaxID=2211108 RepID=UPI000F815F0E|nr:TlpA disulfide reductase family protein [Sulfuricystis multivorans]
MRTLLFILITCLSTFTRAQDAEALFAAKLTDAQEKPASLAGFRGKPMIVNFWARWCSPCRDEMPEIRALENKYRAQGLAVVGIAIEENSANARDFLKAYEIEYPNFFAGARGTELLKALGNDKAGLPFTVFIDRQGKLIGHKLGRISRSELEAAADALLQ